MEETNDKMEFVMQADDVTPTPFIQFTDDSASPMACLKWCVQNIVAGNFIDTVVADPGEVLKLVARVASFFDSTGELNDAELEEVLQLHGQLAVPVAGVAGGAAAGGLWQALLLKALMRALEEWLSK